MSESPLPPPRHLWRACAVSASPTKPSPDQPHTTRLAPYVLRFTPYVLRLTPTPHPPRAYEPNPQSKIQRFSITPIFPLPYGYVV
ncbi:MAG: hypothetical protein GXP38_06955 [Chloroflexi bacterium]|nr:hypothetical protein [Chloroflexota bacterium]